MARSAVRKTCVENRACVRIPYPRAESAGAKASSGEGLQGACCCISAVGGYSR